MIIYSYSLWRRKKKSNNFDNLIYQTRRFIDWRSKSFCQLVHHSKGLWKIALQWTFILTIQRKYTPFCLLIFNYKLSNYWVNFRTFLNTSSEKRKNVFILSKNGSELFLISIKNLFDQTFEASLNHWIWILFWLCYIHETPTTFPHPPSNLTTDMITIVYKSTYIKYFFCIFSNL